MEFERTTSGGVGRVMRSLMRFVSREVDELTELRKEDDRRTLSDSERREFRSRVANVKSLTRKVRSISAEGANG